MDLMVTILVWVIVLSIAFAILKYLIMPVVPEPMRAIIWALIGLVLLVVLIEVFFVGTSHRILTLPVH